MAPEIDGRLLLADGWAYPGTLVEAEIVEAHADDLVGHIVAGAEAGAARPRVHARARIGGDDRSAAEGA
jgi:hypothetical protein